MPDYLIDTSGLVRLKHPAVAERLEPLVAEARVGVCAITELEMAVSSRSPSRHASETARRRALFPSCALHQHHFDRALDVQTALVGRGWHRKVALPDLIVAAVAELGRMVLLHHDADFDRIAEVTGQPVEWVMPRSSG